jgi:hypothetical protein
MISGVMVEKIVISNQVAIGKKTVIGKNIKSAIEMAAGEPLPPSLCILNATAWSVALNTKRQFRAGG